MFSYSKDFRPPFSFPPHPPPTPPSMHIQFEPSGGLNAFSVLAPDRIFESRPFIPSSTSEESSEEILEKLEQAGRVPSKEKFRRMACNTFIYTGACPYNDRCVFLHDIRIKAENVKVRTTRQTRINNSVKDTFYWPDMTRKDVVKNLDTQGLPTANQVYEIPEAFRLQPSNFHNRGLYSLWTHFVEFCVHNSVFYTTKRYRDITSEPFFMLSAYRDNPHVPNAKRLDVFIKLSMGKLFVPEIVSASYVKVSTAEKGVPVTDSNPAVQSFRGDKDFEGNLSRRGFGNSFWEFPNFIVDADDEQTVDLRSHKSFNRIPFNKPPAGETLPPPPIIQLPPTTTVITKQADGRGFQSATIAPTQSHGAAQNKLPSQPSTCRVTFGQQTFYNVEPPPKATLPLQVTEMPKSAPLKSYVEQLDSGRIKFGTNDPHREPLWPLNSITEDLYDKQPSCNHEYFRTTLLTETMPSNKKEAAIPAVTSKKASNGRYSQLSTLIGEEYDRCSDDIIHLELLPSASGESELPAWLTSTDHERPLTTLSPRDNADTFCWPSLSLGASHGINGETARWDPSSSSDSLSSGAPTNHVEPPDKQSVYFENFNQHSFFPNIRASLESSTLSSEYEQHLKRPSFGSGDIFDLLDHESFDEYDGNQ